MDVNIHLELPPEIFRVAKRMNEEINSIASSEVDFGRHTPHLTLTMGSLLGEASPGLILGKAAELAGITQSFTLETTCGYLAPPENNYAFLNAEPKESIRKVKHLAYEKFKNCLSIPWTGHPDCEPHITVGYIAQKQDAIAAWLSVNSVSAQGRVAALCVSEMGARGTCGRLIERFPFLGSKVAA